MGGEPVLQRREVPRRGLLGVGEDQRVVAGLPGDTAGLGAGDLAWRPAPQEGVDAVDEREEVVDVAGDGADVERPVQVDVGVGEVGFAGGGAGLGLEDEVGPDAGVAVALGGWVGGGSTIN